jgi:microcin C transport system permease protein
MATPVASETIFRKRLRKFTRLKRGYYSFLFLLTLYVFSFFFPLIMNSYALLVSYQSKWYFPVWQFCSRDSFGLKGLSEVNYRSLQRTFEKRELARTQGVLIRQFGFYPHKKYVKAAVWEPIEDWLIGYRIDVAEALSSGRFSRYSYGERLLSEAEQDVQKSRQAMYELYVGYQQNPWPETSDLLQRAWQQVAAAAPQFSKHDFTGVGKEVSQEIAVYKVRENDLQEAERAYYSKLRVLSRALQNLLKNERYVSECREELAKEKSSRSIFLSYWNNNVNPLDVNPNWQPDRRMQKYPDGVGFDLKCHLLENSDNIAVIDELVWRKEQFEALHLENYFDFTGTIVKAEKSLPQEHNWVILAPYNADYRENFRVGNEYPTSRHWLGTDESGRDVLVRMCYGFNISISFAVIVLFFSYTIGIAIGAILGYFGSFCDLLGLRLVEIWSAIPFLYIVIILSALFTPQTHPDKSLLQQPALWLLTLILSSFGWMGICYYVRGEFLREKAKEYVAAAISIGTPHYIIIFKHILPNALTSVISFAPFIIVGEISALVSLDFLGFGLPSPMPSWGELLSQGIKPENGWHMIVSPVAFMFITLITIVFIGEAVREAFDPKVYSRLR